MFKALLSRKFYRRAGDAARGRGDWKDAERNYRLHLARMPADAAIWTQLGHTLKEQGDVEEAIMAYRRATEARPRDAETWLYLAHVLLRDGQKPEAKAAFERAHALSGSKESYENALLLGAKVTPIGVPKRDPVTFLLLDDLFRFLAHNVTLSGIQRVQVGIIASLLKKDVGGYRFLLTSEERNQPAVTFWDVSADEIRAVIDYAASGSDLERPLLNKLLRAADLAGRRAAFAPGDIVFVPGAFWIVEKTGEAFAALKAAGVKIGVYVYDLIPISHPEFCDFGLVDRFTRAFTEMVQFVDFFATISDYVAQTLAEFLVTNNLRSVPITPIPLAHFLTIPDMEKAGGKKFVKQFDERLKKRPYALYVSTLEGRKNHIYVVNAWQELLRRGVEMPDLVFLGRRGWRSEGLSSFLDGTRYLNGRVHLMHDVSDGDLAHLYRNCQFTLFTSFVEGWGLPVGESLVFGKPCIASDNCSIPEVGGDLVDYVDPMNLRAGIEAIERMVTDTAYRDARTQAIAETFEPRSWDDVADLFNRLTASMHDAPSLPLDRVFVPAGEQYSFRWAQLDLDDLSNLLAFPSRIILGSDFYNQEERQVWMRGTSATIAIPTEFAEGSTALFALNLTAPPWGNKLRFVVSPPGTDDAARRRAFRRLVETHDMPFVAVATIPVGPGGVATLRIDAIDPIEHVEADGREFYLGIRSLAYVDASMPGAEQAALACFANTVSFDFEGGQPSNEGADLDEQQTVAVRVAAH